MRALPFWQPWAQLVVDGVKLIETRPRPTSTIVGERIAVYATKTQPPGGSAAAQARWPFRELGYGVLPVGALVGTVFVVDCVRMDEAYVRYMRERWPREYAMGDYRPGRYAFALRDARRFRAPVAWKGSQGVMMVPDQVVRTAECERCVGGTITVPSGCFSASLRPCPECRPEEAAATAGLDAGPGGLFRL